jgi:hypothetical protein
MRTFNECLGVFLPVGRGNLCQRGPRLGFPARYRFPRNSDLTPAISMRVQVPLRGTGYKSVPVRGGTCWHKARCRGSRITLCSATVSPAVHRQRHLRPFRPNLNRDRSGVRYRRVGKPWYRTYGTCCVCVTTRRRLRRPTPSGRCGSPVTAMAVRRRARTERLRNVSSMIYTHVMRQNAPAVRSPLDAAVT